MPTRPKHCHFGSRVTRTRGTLRGRGHRCHFQHIKGREIDSFKAFKAAEQSARKVPLTNRIELESQRNKPREEQRIRDETSHDVPSYSHLAAVVDIALIIMCHMFLFFLGQALRRFLSLYPLAQCLPWFVAKMKLWKYGSTRSGFRLFIALSSPAAGRRRCGLGRDGDLSHTERR